jgi:hypothetical protein
MPDGWLCGPISPDGNSLVGRGPLGAIALYSFAGGPPRSIPNVERNFVPVQWSDTGSFLYGYRVGEIPSKVYKLEIATGKQALVRELKPEVPAGVVMVAPVVVSRDGKRFAYSYNQTLSVLYLISGLQ